ncbi:hypothetical protein ACRAWF_38065 [Streptomyces sp. L7]
MIVNAITSFLGLLIEQIMKPIREFLADTLLATPDVTQHADIKRLWTSTLGITAGIYVLFVTAGGITVMGYETVRDPLRPAADRPAPAAGDDRGGHVFDCDGQGDRPVQRPGPRDHGHRTCRTPGRAWSNASSPSPCSVARG